MLPQNAQTAESVVDSNTATQPVCQRRLRRVADDSATPVLLQRSCRVDSADRRQIERPRRAEKPARRRDFFAANRRMTREIDAHRHSGVALILHISQPCRPMHGL